MFDEIESAMLERHGRDLRELSLHLGEYIQDGDLDAAAWLLEAMAMIQNAARRQMAAGTQKSPRS